MSIPKRVIIEYEDGSTKGIEFDKLTSTMQLAISRMEDGSPLSPDASSSNYILMQWKDGWKEVVTVRGGFIDLIRYYVIERIEHRGRMVIDTGLEYPLLLIIKRVPQDLESVIVMSDNFNKYYRLGAEIETSEGIFEAGGKREYTKYDKMDTRCDQVFKTDAEAVKTLLTSLRNELDKKCISAKNLLAEDQDKKILKYTDIALSMGIRGRESQKDVCGFIDMLLNRLVSS